MSHETEPVLWGAALVRVTGLQEAAHGWELEMGCVRMGTRCARLHSEQWAYRPGAASGVHDCQAIRHKWGQERPGHRCPPCDQAQAHQALARGGTLNGGGGTGWTGVIQ